MESVIKKTIFGLVAMLFVPCAVMALDSEYKNSLTKVELKQTSDSGYDVNLYMQKKFNEPVKVIKKNDLSYYILLPETKNSSAGVVKGGSDIKDATAASHKYAGADVNNGYTKININTTKPINFSINVRNSSDVTAMKQKNTSAATSVSQAKSETKIQKKNTDVQKTQVALKQKKESDTSTKSKAVEQTPKKAIASQKVTPKKEVSKVQKTNVKQQVKKQAPKAQPKTQAQPKQQPKQQPKAQPKPQPKVQSEPKAEPKAEVQKEVQSEVQEQVKVPPVLNIDEKDELEQIIPEKEETIVEEQTVDLINEPVNQDEILAPTLKQRFLSKITEYGLSLNDIIFMLCAGLMSIIALLIILRKPSPQQAKLKTKADLIEKLDNTEHFVPKKAEPKPKEKEGQYFVFDKSVKQIAFTEPATTESQKHYELSNYDPDINVKYGKEPDNKESEYDIIQKILKEDSLVEIAPGEFEPKVYNKEPAPAVKEDAAVTEPIKQEVKQETVEPETTEPKVLSSIEIAPERGFMIVSYDNNINLMGYIFDDVFALYNFKRDTIDNPEIKFRLSDKDDKGTNFIVKVENTKVMVRVTKSQMNLLVVM